LDYPAQLFIENCHNELRVLKHKPGDNLSLTSDGFARLTAFSAGIERKYVATQRQMPPVPAARRRQFHHVRFRVPS
jgi:hypothetical protein